MEFGIRWNSIITFLIYKIFRNYSGLSGRSLAAIVGLIGVSRIKLKVTERQKEITYFIQFLLIRKN